MVVVYNNYALMAVMATALLYAPLVFLLGHLVDADGRALGFFVMLGLVGAVMEFLFKAPARLFWLPLWLWGLVAVAAAGFDALGLEGRELIGATAVVALLMGAAVILQIKRFTRRRAEESLTSLRAQVAAGTPPSFRALSRALIVAEQLDEAQRRHNAECVRITLEHRGEQLEDRVRRSAEALLEQLEGAGDRALDPSALERLSDWLKAKAAFE